MRIAVIADVHGNLEALEAVVSDLKVSMPDTVVSLGDIVGYGANPQECCDRVREIAQDNIMGNHDAAAADVIDTGSFNDEARQGIEWTKQQLAASSVSWLQKAPYTVEYEGALFSHGSPVNPGEFDYILSVRDIEKVFYAFDNRYPVFLVGHAHRRFAVSKNIHGDEEPVIDYSDVIRMDEHRQYIISVGSVGQPRDSDTTTSYGILDTDKGIYTVKRLPYAIKEASDKILKAGLPKWLAYRLMIGV